MEPWRRLAKAGAALAVLAAGATWSAFLAAPPAGAAPDGPLRPLLIAPGAVFASSGTNVPLSPSDLGYFRGVSCPSAVTCYAAGSTTNATSSGPGAALVATLSKRGGAWEVTAATVDWSNIYDLSSISCTSTKDCAATASGAGNENLVLATNTGNGQSWDEPPGPFSTLPLHSVSCTGNYCMAVGTDLQAKKPHSRVIVTSAAAPTGALGEPGWANAPSLPRGSFRGQPYTPALEAVSCYAPGRCWVVGGGAWLTLDGGRSWQQRSPAATTGGHGLQLPRYSLLDAVQFWGADGIVAGGDQCGSVAVFVCSGAIFVTHDSGRDWSLAQPSRSMPFVESLSCASPAGACVATAEKYSGDVGKNGGRPVATAVLSSKDAQHWQLGSWVPGVSAVASSCPPTGSCLAVGGLPNGSEGLAFLTGPSAAVPAAHGRNPQLSSIGGALPSPSKAFSPLSTDVVNAGIAVGAALFITFPANLFNSTFEENYDDIAAWWRRWRDRALPAGARESIAGAARRAWASLAKLWRRALHLPGPPAERGRARFGWALVGGSLLGALLDPQFGANLRTVLVFLAIGLAMMAGVAVSGVVTGGYHRLRKHADVAYQLEALPAGLVVALACVLISRGTGFTPGYLYGVICGVSFGRKLAADEEGHVVALSAAARVVVGVAAWLMWAAVNGYARRPGSFFGAVLVDDFLASLFVSGLVSTVISLFPLRFLPGHKLQAWHKGVWAGTFALALFVLVQVLLRPHGGGGGSTHVPLVTTLGLFILFGAGSVAFRDHFARKRRRPAVAATALTDDDGVALFAGPAGRVPPAGQEH